MAGPGFEARQLDPRVHIFSTAMALNHTMNEALWEHREEPLRLLSVGVQDVFKEELMFSSARKGWDTCVG